MGGEEEQGDETHTHIHQMMSQQFSSGNGKRIWLLGCIVLHQGGWAQASDITWRPIFSVIRAFKRDFPDREWRGGIW